MVDERSAEMWAAERRWGPIETALRFTDEGLVLGRGTVLAKAAGPDRQVSIDASGLRLKALLTAAHLDQPSSLSIEHLRKAANCWRDGDKAMAAMHLALSRVDRLANPEADAQRLFRADALMAAGCDPIDVIDAFLGGDAKIMRLEKSFNADQPRVPAGSGQSSGQWTSGGAGVTIGSKLLPQVKAPTLVNAAGGISSTHACDIAQADCVTAAIEASAHDAANDNARFIDMTNCKAAGLACDALSWVIEDLPLPLSGGVIFPHRGVVLITKGMLDEYIPPVGGRRPPIRRSLASAPVSAQGEPRSAENLSPPCTPAADETSLPDAIGLGACQRVINALSSKVGGTVSDQTYSQSKLWGKIARAKISYQRDGSAESMCAVCWQGSGTGVHAMLSPSCC